MITGLVLNVLQQFSRFGDFGYGEPQAVVDQSPLCAFVASV
jgi:hypothetical protein